MTEALKPKRMGFISLQQIAKQKDVPYPELKAAVEDQLPQTTHEVRGGRIFVPPTAVLGIVHRIRQETRRRRKTRKKHIVSPASVAEFQEVLNITEAEKAVVRELVAEANQAYP